MLLTLNKDHSLITKEKIIGVSEENKSEVLQVAVQDESLFDKWAYIEFVLDNGVTFLTPRLEIVDGMIEYVLPNSIMVSGYLKIQLVFRNAENWVWKSFIKQVIVRNALNVSGEVAKENPDFITEAQKILDEVEEKVIEVDNKVDKSTKINNHTLDTDVELVAEDIGISDITDGEIDNLFA